MVRAVFRRNLIHNYVDFTVHKNWKITSDYESQSANKNGFTIGNFWEDIFTSLIRNFDAYVINLERINQHRSSNFSSLQKFQPKFVKNSLGSSYNRIQINKKIQNIVCDNRHSKIDYCLSIVIVDLWVVILVVITFLLFWNFRNFIQFSRFSGLIS